MKYGKEPAKLEATFANKSLKGNFNDKQKYPKSAVDKGTLMEHPFWVCSSKHRMEFGVNTIQVVAYLHSKHK